MSGISNEVGRCKRVFSGVLASAGHTRPLASKRAFIDGVRVFTLALGRCVAFIAAVLPTNHLFGPCGPIGKVEASTNFGG